MKILMIDIGGSNVKLMLTGQKEMRKIPSDRKFSAKDFVTQVKENLAGWSFDAISMGFPGLVKDGQLVREPLNLGGGWLDFSFEKAFGCPVRIINDAALQALASYKGGRMLFVGFGTSIGGAVVADDVIVPIELGLVSLRNGEPFLKRLTKVARKENGGKKWQRDVEEAVILLQDVFWPEDTVIGGGNAKHLDPLPPGTRRRSNRDAIIGAQRLWEGADMLATPYGTTWRIERGRKKK